MVMKEGLKKFEAKENICSVRNKKVVVKGGLKEQVLATAKMYVVEVLGTKRHNRSKLHDKYVRVSLGLFVNLHYNFVDVDI